MRLIRDERGTAAAEFAVVVPAAVLVVALAAGTLQAVSRQVRLEQGAAQAARLAGRGEDPGRIGASLGVTGASVVVRGDGDLVCAEATAPAGVPLPLPPLTASSCALAGGR
ncbi:TadE family type IV pilus minor pilin [Microbacterium sp. No. 7]|uniref:TadE family type IV pilus minor pilin n=1 Tax=Microbacterium sp. No. 7 TaxID=1714373 RepID=UPI0006D1AE4D|nr:TadE family type IV pilus minor pilin [Microbacterium sp. No. 7]ALJ19485.1 TadE family protein [Microbacterium sp. No. 7]